MNRTLCSTRPERSLEIHVPISPNRQFFTMVHHLAASLRVNGGVLSDTPIVVTVGEDCEPFDIAEQLPWAAQYPIEWRWLPRERYRTHQFYATAVDRFCQDFRSEYVLMLDADILVTGRLDDLLEEVQRTRSFVGLVAHVSPFPHEMDTAEMWCRLFAAAGLPDPIFAYEHTAWDPADPHSRRYCPAYFNLGVLMAPAILMRRIGATIYQDMERVNALMETDYRCQLALSLSLARTAAPSRAMSMRFNFPNDSAIELRYPHELEDVRILHYLRPRPEDHGKIASDYAIVERFLRSTAVDRVNRVLQQQLHAVHARAMADLAKCADQRVAVGGERTVRVHTVPSPSSDRIASDPAAPRSNACQADPAIQVVVLQALHDIAGAINVVLEYQREQTAALGIRLDELQQAIENVGSRAGPTQPSRTAAPADDDSATEAERVEQRWAEGVEHELQFWDDWLGSGGGRWPKDFAMRLDPQSPVGEPVATYLRALPREQLQVLDVGAGPLTALGKILPDKALHITAIDPLAEHYDFLLNKHGIDPPVRTRTGFAERLGDLFQARSFDAVHARNCLDRGLDPLQAVKQMLHVVREDGVVMLFHHENEGSRENHQGFHQWDFTCVGGEFVIRSREGRACNVTRELAESARVEAECTDGYLKVILSKYAAAAVPRRQSSAGGSLSGSAVDKVKWIERLVPGRSFADIGGLSGTVNEMVTVAARAGATRYCMVDMQPEGNEWWRAFHEHCRTRGVEDYACHIANLEDPMLPERLGKFDVVHCSGILYHAPDPVHLLRQLRRLTREHLILTTMAVPERIATSRGEHPISTGAAYFIPALDERDRALFSEHFDRLSIQVPGVNAPAVARWMDGDVNYEYGPWWWLWTPRFVAKMLEVVGFEVLEGGETREGRSHSFLCSKVL